MNRNYFKSPHKTMINGYMLHSVYICTWKDSGWRFDPWSHTTRRVQILSSGVRFESTNWTRFGTVISIDGGKMWLSDFLKIIRWNVYKLYDYSLMREMESKTYIIVGKKRMLGNRCTVYSQGKSLLSPSILANFNVLTDFRVWATVRNTWDTALQKAQYGE